MRSLSRRSGLRVCAAALGSQHHVTTSLITAARITFSAAPYHQKGGADPDNNALDDIQRISHNHVSREDAQLLHLGTTQPHIWSIAQQSPSS
jgi:hypothetical protein